MSPIPSIEKRKQLIRGSSAFLQNGSMQKIMKQVRRFLDERIDSVRITRPPEELGSFETIFGKAPAVTCVLEGPDFVFKFANEAYYELLGNTRDVIGRPILEVLPELKKQGFDKILERTYSEGKTHRSNEVRIELDQVGGGSKEVYIDFVYQPKRNVEGKVCGVVFIAIDVTCQVLARKEAEMFAERLQTAVVCRDEFMSIASHELKTPITSLKLQLQLTQRRLASALGDGPMAAKVSRAIDQSNHQVDRLTNLVDDLMDVTRIHSGRMIYNFKIGSISETLREVLNRHEALFREHACALRTRIASELFAKFDHVRIEQVIMNLINNALKYAPGSPIEVDAYAEDKWVVISVCDHGPGIPPTFRDRIFDRFERGPNAGKTSGGLGLGLFIVRQIVRAHDGLISLAETERSGAKFVIRLPRELIPLPI